LAISEALALAERHPNPGTVTPDYHVEAKKVKEEFNKRGRILRDARKADPPAQVGATDAVAGIAGLAQ
jgi:hypothetical protein